MNGTRMGKLCDFGGRRELGDADTFAKPSAETGSKITRRKQGKWREATAA